jgi:hypothetical protein
MPGTRRISREQHLRAIFSQPAGFFGTCGTCARRAEATQSNEGYSDCCNDRIEYDLEASETRARIIADNEAFLAESAKKLRSFSSRICVARKAGQDVTAIERERDNLKQWVRIAKQDIKAIRAGR